MSQHGSGAHYRRLAASAVFALLMIGLAVTLAWPTRAQALVDRRVRSFSAGSYHSAAVAMDGSLWTWGSNSYGQLGDGTLRFRPNPTRIGTSTEWRSVSAGGDHTIALKADGSLWMWGLRTWSEGSGDPTYRVTPTRIGSDADWSFIEAGTLTSYGIKTDGTLWRWGLGDDPFTIYLEPVRVGTDSDWASVSAGGEHVLALKTDGTLWGWGDNRFGQLANLGTATVLTPVPVGDSEDRWVLVSAGGYHSAGIKTDGSLWTWGWNGEGQLGNGVRSGPANPWESGSGNPNPSRVGAGTWVSVSAGPRNTSAVASDGTLWGWGDNMFSKLGDGTAVDRLSPVRIGAATTWASVDVGRDHVLAARQAGTLWAWGHAEYGKVGRCSLATLREPARVKLEKLRVSVSRPRVRGTAAPGRVLTVSGATSYGYPWGGYWYGQSGDPSGEKPVLVRVMYRKLGSLKWEKWGSDRRAQMLGSPAPPRPSIRSSWRYRFTLPRRSGTWAFVAYVREDAGHVPVGLAERLKSPKYWSRSTYVSTWSR